MLFSGKENDFMCLAVTKFILRKINSGVWLLQIFLQKMLYMPNFPHTSSTVNMQIINNSTIIHRKSKTQQKNSSNRCRRDRRRRSVQRRRRWDHAALDEMGGEIGAIVRLVARSTSTLVGRSRRSSIDERARNLDRRGARSSDDRAACRSPFCFFSLVGRSLIGRSCRLSLLPLSLSPIWALSSLSLSLSLSLSPEMIWSENKSVKLIPGQRSKYWSTGNEFPENKIFRCSQTCGLGWKWFPEIIFTQNKRSRSFFLLSVEPQKKFRLNLSIALVIFRGGSVHCMI